MRFAIDPELRYCPRCREEYRADIACCADCELPLVSGTDLLGQQERQASRSLTIADDDPMADIRKGPVIQIKQVQALLRQHRIPSLTAADPATCGKACCGGPELLLRVRQADLDEAVAILRDEYLRTTGLQEADLEDAGLAFHVGSSETTCPACGFTFAAADSSACPDCGLSIG